MGDNMIIKNHLNRNDYCLAKCGHWVRDFTKKIAKPCDINDITPLEDIKLIIENEFKNSLKRYQVAETNVTHDKVVIISDGYGFEKNVKLIEELSPDVIIIGVNGAFAKWKSERRLNYYIVNNPYQECLYYYPQIIRTWPKCIASTRTNPNFLDIYKGLLYVYSPTNGTSYSGITKEEYNFLIDDYRNPICAAIGLSYKYGVKKMLLMSTLEMYEKERPGSDIVKDGFWMYPQQKMAHALIDANLYWMKKAKIDVNYTDTEPDYEFATYINSGDIKRFFNG